MREPGEFAFLAAGLRDLIGRLPEDVSVRGAAKAADVPKNTAFAWVTEGRFPQEIDGMLRLVRAVRKMAEMHGVTGLDDGEMAALLDEQRWREAYKAEVKSRAAGYPPGRGPHKPRRRSAPGGRWPRNRSVRTGGAPTGPG